MKFLITGSMGYIGPHVVAYLRAKYPDAIIEGYDAGYFADALTTLAPFPERALNAQHFGDVRQSPPSVFAGVDVVVHLAAISNDPMGMAFEQATLAINHAGTIDMARKAKDAGVKHFVFFSSCSVYGCAEDGARTEKSELNPLTAYARSKVDAEVDLEKLADKNFIVTCLRYATACGFSPRLRLDLVLNDFVASAMALKKINILSDGTPWRPLINAQDMPRAMDWAAHRSEQEGGVFLIMNAGSDAWTYQVKDLAVAVQRHMPEVQISINKDAAPDKRSYKVDFSLYRKLAPHHQPVSTLDGTVEGLRDGLKAIGFADPDFRQSRLMRLKELNNLKKDGFVGDDLRWKK